MAVHLSGEQIRKVIKRIYFNRRYSSVFSFFIYKHIYRIIFFIICVLFSYFVFFFLKKRRQMSEYKSQRNRFFFQQHPIVFWNMKSIMNILPWLCSYSELFMENQEINLFYNSILVKWTPYFQNVMTIISIITSISPQ